VGKIASNPKNKSSVMAPLRNKLAKPVNQLAVTPSKLPASAKPEINPPNSATGP
jgi:hypothetical protein